MPRFSKKSFTNLSTCHADLQALFYEVIKNVDCSILQGYRNKEDQDAAFLAKRTKLQYPNSKHNYTPALAVDVSPYPIPPWENIPDFIFFAGYVMGIADQLKAAGKITSEIRCGADWNKNNRVSDEKFKDYLHFEIVS